MVTPLKRMSFDIGAFGEKGVGKTIFLVWQALWNLFYGVKLFSNMEKLEIPNIYIDSIQDLKTIKDYPKFQRKLFIGDDFERWFFSRSFSSDVSKELNSILLDFGKCNTSILYSAKREMAIDIGLRETTSRFFEMELYLPFLPKNGDKKIINEWKKDLEKLAIAIYPLDSNLNQLKPKSLFNLDQWAKLYDTQEMIKDVRS